MKKGTLELGEFHPAASDAYLYVMSLGIHVLVQYQEAFCSCAIEGDRPAEILAETLRRLLEGEPVSDRYLLGLAWVLKTGEEGCDTENI